MSKIKETQKRKTGISRLIEIAGTKKWFLIISMLLSILASIAQFVPYISVYKILTILSQNVNHISLIDTDAISYWATITFFAFIAYGILQFISLILSHIAAFNILYELRIKIARKLTKLPLGFFTKNTSGKIKKIMNEDVEKIELFVAHHIPDIASATIVPMIFIIYMFYIDWILALIVLSVFLVAMSLMFKMMLSNASKVYYQNYAEAMVRMNASIIEYIRGIKVIKTFVKSTKAYKQLHYDINYYCDTTVDIAIKCINSYTLFGFLLSLIIVLVTPVATWFLIHAENYQAYLPNMLLFLIFSLGIFFPVVKLTWITGFMNQNKMGMAAIDDILYQPEIINSPYEINIKDASIEFFNVSFSYNNKTNILEKISFTAKPGSITALVGPSGSGKTTIAMLTARFWDVNQGEIKIGGIPIKEIPIELLMDQIAFVFQDNMLFFDTIEENIRMGNHEASFEDVVNAAKIAQCHEFIEALPQSYKTFIGEGGTYLSGGEVQRLDLARVALKNSPIILLDEATAFSDPENESKILAAFKKIIKDKTVLIIAHRLGTITNADQILYIDKGKITEKGTHDELLQLNQHYAQMWNTYITSRDWVLKK